LQIITSTKYNATVAQFTHSWVEPSIIAKIPGRSSGPVTILGAHMDSINLRSPTTGRAPGADDDGSGTVNLIEAFRALATAGYRPPTPIEFHWYAGEEGGLLGSSAIASSYDRSNVQVKGMMQLDMTA
jgi:bacterial leucyl aminopeptidase